MGFFSRKPIDDALPDENTIDRAYLKNRQLAKLREAEALKERSSAVAASLEEEGQINHYIQRIRAGYILREKNA